MIDTLELSGEPPAAPDLKRTRRRKDPTIDLSKIDRLPPHSLEAEQGALGCMLIAPNEAIGVCVEKFKRGPETFYDLRHQTLYETLVEMSDRKEAVDLITVRQRLKDKGQLEAIGGVAFSPRCKTRHLRPRTCPSMRTSWSRNISSAG